MNHAAKGHARTHARLLLGLLLGVSPWALSYEASAQTAPVSDPGSARVNYDIPAQNLSRALTDYARQSDLHILTPYDRLSGLTAPPVRGSFSREEALALVLSQSGVSARIVGENIEIAEQTLPQPRRAVEPGRASDEHTDARSTTIEEDLVVTGTRIRGAAPSGANVITLDRDDIDATGRTTLAEVVQTLPQNFAGSQNDGNQMGAIEYGRNIAFGSTVNLRGLGADATLTLLNGRRLAASGWGNFVDTHVVLRGKDEHGRNLILPPDFVKHGFRNLARDAATDRLGARSRDQAREALRREALIHGPTRLDKLIENQLDEGRQVRVAALRAPNGGAGMTDALKSRARELRHMGLAHEVRRNVLQFEPGWRDALKAMELHLDIRKALVQARTRGAEPDRGAPTRAPTKDRALPFKLGL